uniref:Uncharacterized protein n=1 Tax=Romanomermis culicivorax TaxID=13658 RepID=A0A915IHZ1_ROMCU
NGTQISRVICLPLIGDAGYTNEKTICTINAKSSPIQIVHNAFIINKSAYRRSRLIIFNFVCRFDYGRNNNNANFYPTQFFHLEIKIFDN